MRCPIALLQNVRNNDRRHQRLIYVTVTPISLLHSSHEKVVLRSPIENHHHTKRGNIRLVVKEGKTSDEVVQSIGSSGQIMTEQFRCGKHGQASVLEFLGLTLGKGFRFQVWLALLS